MQPILRQPASAFAVHEKQFLRILEMDELGVVRLNVVEELLLLGVVVDGLEIRRRAPLRKYQIRTGGAGEFGNGCATYKWKLSRPAFLPVVFKLTIQMAAAESQDRVGSSNGPEHS